MKTADVSQNTLSPGVELVASLNQNHTSKPSIITVISKHSLLTLPSLTLFLYHPDTRRNM